MKKEPPYTLDTAVKLARIFEAAFKPDYHICLGGSCLHKGESQKDVDLYVYPDSDTLLHSADSGHIINKIKEIGGEIKTVYLRIDIKKGYVNKPLIQFTFKGYPIDLFFIHWDSVATVNNYVSTNAGKDSMITDQYNPPYDDDEPPF